MRPTPILLASKFRKFRGHSTSATDNFEQRIHVFFCFRVVGETLNACCFPVSVERGLSGAAVVWFRFAIALLRTWHRIRCSSIFDESLEEKCPRILCRRHGQVFQVTVVGSLHDLGAAACCSCGSAQMPQLQRQAW